MGGRGGGEYVVTRRGTKAEGGVVDRGCKRGKGGGSLYHTAPHKHNTCNHTHQPSTAVHPLTTTTTNHLPVATVLVRHLATLGVEKGEQLGLHEADVVVVPGPIEEHPRTTDRQTREKRTGNQVCTMRLFKIPKACRCMVVSGSGSRTVTTCAIGILKLLQYSHNSSVFELENGSDTRHTKLPS